MADFQVGDRVRVRATPGTASYAGRKGIVAWVSRAVAGAVYAYHVRFDGSLPGVLGDLRAAFRAHELGPETPGESARWPPRRRPRGRRPVPARRLGGGAVAPGRSPYHDGVQRR